MSRKFVLALTALFILTATPALADDYRHDRGSRWSGDHYRGEGRHHKHMKHHRAKRHDRRVVWHSGRHWVPPGHRKHRHKAVVHKHHHDYQRGGHKHRHGYRRHRDDDWALYAILALQIVDVLNESQRDHVVWAQRRAYSVPLGDTIQWNDGGASGSVVPTRDGRDAAGRYCREFQQQIVIGQRRQSGYGVACRQPDGAWEVIS
ncbi:hypothetical protein [Pelagibius marinus]|uniref:hypothetical protein n=1 Tax=Pelagibius marinus TaxID=2762760 RepID=UPI001872E32D|nr:hypothetical protein [Pelagibius marinus]